MAVLLSDKVLDGPRYCVLELEFDVFVNDYILIKVLILDLKSLRKPAHRLTLVACKCMNKMLFLSLFFLLPLCVLMFGTHLHEPQIFFGSSHLLRIHTIILIITFTLIHFYYLDVRQLPLHIVALHYSIGCFTSTIKRI